MSIVVQDLSKVYNTQKAVDHISFQAQPGDILGFLGPNGAGKSTTMKIATGYLSPTSGSVQVCGYDVMENSVEVRKKVGYLPEHNPLYLDMYVHEYLRFIGSLHSMNGKSLKNRVDEMVEICGLSLEQHKKIGALSKGYRQRIGLAQSLIHDPQVLILDEPTTGLDPNQITEIRNLIKNISQKKTVIFSTHIMQEVQALCNRVIIIHRGKVVTDSLMQDLQTTLKTPPQAQIEVEFATPVDHNQLRQIPGIKHIDKTDENKYLIEHEEVADKEGVALRKAIFYFAATHQLPLIGLQVKDTTHTESASLEDIFRSLTQN